MEEDAIEATTQLLRRMRDGDRGAEGELLPRVYDELRRLAARTMRGRREETLQPTALVHEAYLRMTGGAAEPGWNSRAHFVGVAAKAMRSVLVDHVRRKRASTRDAGEERVGLDDVAAAFEHRVSDLVVLDAALERFATIDPHAARVVELRFFAGLSHEDVASATGSSERTVRRLWQTAKLWLAREVEREQGT